MRRVLARAVLLGTAAAVTASLQAVPLARPVDLATDQSEAAQLAAKLSALDGAVQAAAERYDAATAQLAQDQAELAGVRARIASETRTLGRERALLARAALGQFTSGDALAGMGAVLAGSPNSAAIVQTDVSVAATDETSLVAQYRAMALALEVQRAQLAALVRSASQTAAVAASARAAAASEQASVESALASLKGQMAQLVAQAQAAQQRAVEQRASVQLASETAAVAATPAAQGASASLLEQAASIAEAIAARGDTGYSYGAAGEWSGGVQYFDCSGLVTYVFAQLGLALPHDAAAQAADSAPIGYGQLVPGDLVFYDTLGSAGIDHVAIYVGGGSVVEATEPGRPVAVDPIGWSGTPVAFGQP